MDCMAPTRRKHAGPICHKFLAWWVCRVSAIWFWFSRVNGGSNLVSQFSPQFDWSFAIGYIYYLTTVCPFLSKVSERHSQDIWENEINPENRSESRCESDMKKKSGSFWPFCILGSEFQSTCKSVINMSLFLCVAYWRLTAENFAPGKNLAKSLIVRGFLAFGEI